MTGIAEPLKGIYQSQAPSNLASNFSSYLFSLGIQERIVLNKHFFAGFCRKKTGKNLADFLSEKGIPQIIQDGNSSMFWSETARFFVSVSSSDYYLEEDAQSGTQNVTMSSLDKDLFEDFKKFFLENYEKPEPKTQNWIYILGKNSSGQLAFIEAGVAGEAVKRENYSDEVLLKFDHIKEQIGASLPIGRFAILQGSPGTGKSYLIRGMLNEVKDVMFLYVPVSMITSITDPNFISLLIENKSEHSKRVVIILEDADACLVPRDRGNINEISNLLNLTDGLLGQVIDLFVVATTNAEVETIDEAILRPGRLCAEVRVLPHNKKKAISILQGIAKCDEETARSQLRGNDEWSLAEIYEHGNQLLQRAKISVLEQKKAEKASFGFA